jgi:hypothetical protein
MSKTGGQTFNFELPDDTGSPLGNLQGYGWLGIDLSSVGGPANVFCALWEPI